MNAIVSFIQPAEVNRAEEDIPSSSGEGLEEIHVLDAGRKALETHCAEITQLLRDFLARKLAST